jgi:hypothetical protein
MRDQRGERCQIGPLAGEGQSVNMEMGNGRDAPDYAPRNCRELPIALRICPDVMHFSPRRLQTAASGHIQTRPLTRARSIVEYVMQEDSPRAW